MSWDLFRVSRWLTRPRAIRIHRWLGLAACTFWLIQATTGILSVFHWELEDKSVSSVWKPTDLHAIQLRLEALAPPKSGKRVSMIWTTAGLPDRYDVWVEDEPGGPTTVVRLAGDGTLLRAKPESSRNCFGYVTELHQSLLAGKRGRWIVGLSGIAIDQQFATRPSLGVAQAREVESSLAASHQFLASRTSLCAGTGMLGLRIRDPRPRAFLGRRSARLQRWHFLPHRRSCAFDDTAGCNPTQEHKLHHRSRSSIQSGAYAATDGSRNAVRATIRHTAFGSLGRASFAALSARRLSSSTQVPARSGHLSSVVAAAAAALHQHALFDPYGRGRRLAWPPPRSCRRNLADDHDRSWPSNVEHPSQSPDFEALRQARLGVGSRFCKVTAQPAKHRTSGCDTRPALT